MLNPGDAVPPLTPAVPGGDPLELPTAGDDARALRDSLGLIRYVREQTPAAA